MKYSRVSLPLDISLLIGLLGALVACGGSVAQPAPSSPGGSGPAVTTTLQAETGNNTSAADSFVAQTNGNASAGNVSKLPLRSLLYSGSNTRIYATWLGWFGKEGPHERWLQFGRCRTGASPGGGHDQPRHTGRDCGLVWPGQYQPSTMPRCCSKARLKPMLVNSSLPSWKM